MEISNPLSLISVRPAARWFSCYLAIPQLILAYLWQNSTVVGE
jgi:hypothetical protein